MRITENMEVQRKKNNTQNYKGQNRKAGGEREKQTTFFSAVEFTDFGERDELQTLGEAFLLL